MDCTAPVFLRNISLKCKPQFAVIHLLFKICPTGFSLSVQHDSPWFAGALLSIPLLLPFSLTPQQMHQPHCSDSLNFANFYFTYSWGKYHLNVWCGKKTHSLKTKILLPFQYILFTNPPPPPSLLLLLNLYKMKWQSNTAHLQTDRSAMKWFYWPPHLTCMASLRQSTHRKIMSCPGPETQQQETQRKI